MAPRRRRSSRSPAVCFAPANRVSIFKPAVYGDVHAAAREHLWAVARTLHPDDESGARAWVEPLLTKLKADEGCGVITELEQLRPRLEGSAGEHLEREINYLKSHRERLDYGTAKARGEPLGSGAMESTCRQYQCRFKRPGQFWTQPGDEALLCLETSRRHGRWHLLFPHAAPIDPSKN